MQLWEGRHIEWRGREERPELLKGADLMEYQLTELVCTALLNLSCTALGFLLRLSGGRMRMGIVVRRAAGLLLQPGATTGIGRWGIAASLLAFCLFAGGVGMGSLGQLLGVPLPACLGGMAVAVLLRNTTEMTEEEFPDRELLWTGLAALAGCLVSAAAGLMG